MDSRGVGGLVLVILFLEGILSEKILSEMKRCGDPECESLMIRAQASRDYKGPDCRYLNFKTGEEILVYYKLSGKRDDLWQGSQGKEYGYFPKDSVNIEEVYISEEVEVPAKETDFICLDGGEYIFENEDSVLHNNNQEMEYLYPDSDPYLTMPEGELQNPTGISFQMQHRINPTPEKNEQEIESEKPQSLVATAKDGEEETLEQTEGSESRHEDVVPQETITSAWTVSGITGWLGIGGKQEEKALNPNVEPLKENSFHSRKIVLSDEINLEEADDKEEIEHSMSSWFDSDYRDFLPFGRKESDHALEEIETVSETQTQDSAIVVNSAKYTLPLETGNLIEEQEEKTSDSEIVESNWFNLGLDNVFNLGRMVKDTINTKEEQTEEKTDRTGGSESKQMLNALEPESNTDHKEQIRGGAGVDQMQIEEISTILNDYPDSDQNSTSKEASGPRDYQPKKSDKLPNSRWFNLGLDKMFNLDESSEDNIILQQDQTEGKSYGTDRKEATRVSTPGETDSGKDTEETSEIGRPVTEEKENDETDKHLKESTNSENNPPTSEWFSNNVENVLNLKLSTATEELPSAMEVGDKEQATELYSTESPLEGQLMEHANMEEILKETESIKDESGWYENMFGNFIGFHKHLSDKDNGQGSIVSETTEETGEDQLPSSASHYPSIGPTNTKYLKGHIQRQVGIPQSLVSRNHKNNVWSAQSLTSKAEEYLKRKQDDTIFEIKSQSENEEKMVQDTNGNDLKLQVVGHLTERASHYLDLFKDAVLTSNLVMQTDKENGDQTIEHSASVKAQDALRHTVLESPAWQTDYVDEQHTAILTHLNPSKPNDIINKRQEVCNENIVNDNSHDSLSKGKQHESSENVLKHLDGLVNQHVTFSKISSLGELSDSEMGESQENTVAASSSDEIIEPDANYIDDFGNENKMLVPGELLVSAPQYNELFVKDHATDFTQQPLVTKNLIKLERDVNSSDRNVDNISEDSFHFSALNTFSGPLNANEDMLSKAESHSEDLDQLCQGERNHAANPFMYVSSTNEDPRKPVGQNTEDYERKENISEIIENQSISEESKSVNTLQTQESSPHGVLFSAQHNIINEHHIPFKAEEDDSTLMQTLEPFAEKQMQNIQSSDENLFTSNTNEPHDGVVEYVVPVDHGLPGRELEKGTTFKTPGTSSSKGEIVLQKQPGSKQIAGISDQDDSQNESRLHDLSSEADLLQSEDMTAVGTKLNIKDNVKRKKILMGTNHMKDTCMPADLDEHQASQCSHLEYVKSIMSNGMYVVSPSLSLNGEATQISSDSRVITCQEISEKENVNTCYLGTLDYPPSHILDLGEDRSISEQYAANTQSEEHNLEGNTLIAKETNTVDGLQIEESSQSDIFLSNQDNYSLNRHNSLYDKYVEDSSQMSVEPKGQPSPLDEQYLSKESPRIDNFERINKALDLETIQSNDLHKQAMLTSQNSDILSSPSPHIHEHNYKINQNLAHLHTPDLVMIQDKQQDTPTAKHQYQLGNSDISGQTGGSESDRESQERPDDNSAEYQTSVSPKGITDSIFAQTSVFVGNLFAKNSEADHSRSSETELPDNEADGNSEDCMQQNGEPFDWHNTSEFIDNDITFETTGTLTISNVLKRTEATSEVVQFSTQEKKGNIEEIGKYAISLKVSQERIKRNAILNQVDQAISSLFSELQQLHAKINNEEVEHLKSVCEENDVLRLEQHLENVQEEIITVLCEDCSTESTQETVPATKRLTFEITSEAWMKEEIKRTQELQNLLSDIRHKCAAHDVLLSADPGEVTEKAGPEKNVFHKEDSDQQNEPSEQININVLELFANAANDGLLPKQDKNTHTAVGYKHLDDKQTEAHTVLSVNAQEGEYASFANSAGNVKEFSSELSFQFPNQIPSDKTKLSFGIIKYLSVQDIPSNVNFLWSTMKAVLNKAAASLPEDLRPGPDLYGVSWEMVICAALVGFFTLFLFLCRASKVIRSRCYIGRENQLAGKVAELVENKCKELEKLSIYKKQYEELELSLKDASLLKESSGTTCLEATCEKLNQSNSALSDEIGNLEKELEEEKSRRSQQDDCMDDIQRRVESLEKETKTLKSQADEARTTLKVFQINKGRLETTLQDAKEEQIRFQESNDQLLQEAEGWGERFSELTEQTKMFELSKRDMEEALNKKESQVKSLTECLLTMKDWTVELGKENNVDNNSSEEDVTGEMENGEHLDDHQKRTVKKLIYAAKLNASLKTLEAERNQIYVMLSDEVKAKEELAERIDQLQKEQNSLQSGNSHFQNDVQKLQQKLKVMTEMYQENELKLHRKLTVEEKDRLQKEEKLSKVDEKIYHAAEELHSYRTRAKDLEEELEKTIRSYQSQITSHEKKGHDNWLTAREAERHLNDVKKENAHNRQKLTELEFKLELLEKDPYALDVPRVFGREHSPYGPSPLGRPSPETRAFLSPPTLLEGPLRLSPMLPGGERGSRGPEDHAEYSTTNEKAESGSDRVSDHQGAHSDTGSLSPPWERERRINVQASGQYYPDPALHPRRHERYYNNPPTFGRFSGPPELLRSYNMHSLEKTDGQLSAENSLINASTGNGANDNLSNVLNVADHSLPPENEAIGSSFAPPPPQMRGPLLPMDPRGPFLRRVSPFPPPIMDMYGPRDYFPVRDFAGIPRHPMGMRNPFPSRPFLPFPLQKAGFFPTPPPPEIRSELPPRQTHPSGAPDAEHPKPHQET